MKIAEVFGLAKVCAPWTGFGREWDEAGVSPKSAFQSAMMPDRNATRDRRWTSRSMLRAYIILPLILLRDSPECWDAFQRARRKARVVKTWDQMAELIQQVQTGKDRDA